MCYSLLQYSKTLYMHNFLEIITVNGLTLPPEIFQSFGHNIRPEGKSYLILVYILSLF